MKIIECPRDAMQGIEEFIPTDKKARYINQLLKVGFDTLDFGSFVSPKAIPQLADTAKVLEEIDLSSTQTKLLAIVANERGAREACTHPEIDFLGFPFSLSETFQKRNINSTVEQSFERALRIKEIADKHNKKPVIYISMAFGNPYGDRWDADLVLEYALRFYHEMEADIISLSDTIGSANDETISYLFSNLIPQTPKIEIGAHLHTTPLEWESKVKAAYDAGCRRFDGAINGLGGCPMAADKLTGNMPTENLVLFAENQKLPLEINRAEFAKAREMTREVFP